MRPRPLSEVQDAALRLRLRPFREDIRSTSFIELMFLMVFVMMVVLAGAYQVVDNRRDAEAMTKEQLVEQNGLLRSKLVEVERNYTESKSRFEKLQREIAELAPLRSRLAEMQAELTDLRREREALAALLDEKRPTGQRGLADMVRAKLDALNTRVAELERSLGVKPSKSRGRGDPPCWTDAAGKEEYLYTITLDGGLLRVERAWKGPLRSAEVAANPTLAALDGRTLDMKGFGQLAQPIFDQTVLGKCRHHVRVKYVSGPSYEQIIRIARYFYHKMD